MSSTFWRTVRVDLAAYREPAALQYSFFWLLVRVCMVRWLKPSFACVFSYRVNHLMAKRFPRMAKVYGAHRIRKYAVDISYSAQIGPGFRICHLSDIVIGDRVIVGSYMTLYNGVTLGAKHFNKPHLKPKIGDHVTIGTGVKILGDVTIGNNALIGALTFCDVSVPAGAVAYGNPMVIKERL